MLSPSMMMPTTFPDHAPAVAGNRNRESAKSHEKSLIWFPSLLSCDRPGLPPLPRPSFRPAPGSAPPERGFFLSPVRSRPIGKGNVDAFPPLVRF